jgi:hypothetical protein
MSDTSVAKAQQVLQALRDGDVPAEGASELCVGRDTIIDGYRQLLTRATDGQAAVKFISGDYGYGKSLLLRVFEEIALKRHFAVAKVGIKDDLPFNKLTEFYRKIAREIRSIDAGYGIGALLRRWVRNMQTEVEKQAGDVDQFEINERIRNVASKRLGAVREVSPGFARGAQAYLEGVLSNHQEKAHAAETWLRQDPHQRAEAKRLIGVKGDLTPETAWEFLAASLRFVRYVPLAGTVILVDEAEYMRLLPQERLRTVAYDNIRALWDACNNGEIKYTVVMFAATGEMFTDQRRGFPAYAALWERLGTGEDDESQPNLDLRWARVDLPLLGHEQVEELAHKLVKLHGQAEGWQAEARIGDDLIAKIAKQATEGSLLGGGAKPRDFVKAMIRWLDRVQKRPEAARSTLLEIFGDVYRETTQEEIPGEAPAWEEDLDWGEDSR